MVFDEWNWKKDVPKKVARIVQKTLDDIIPTPEISPRRVQTIRKGVLWYVESVVTGYEGKSSRVPTRYLARELSEAVEGEKDPAVASEVRGLVEVLAGLYKRE